MKGWGYRADLRVLMERRMMGQGHSRDTEAVMEDSEAQGHLGVLTGEQRGLQGGFKGADGKEEVGTRTQQGYRSSDRGQREHLGLLTREQRGRRKDYRVLMRR